MVVELGRTQRQLHIASLLERKGGYVTFSYSAETITGHGIIKWVQASILNPLFSRASRVVFYSNKLKDGKAQSIEDLRVAFGDGDMHLLFILSSLEELYLNDTSITDSSIQRIHKLPSLRILVLQRTAVTDACIPWLCRAKQLERLYVDQTQITDNGARRLAASMPNTVVWHQSTIADRETQGEENKEKTKVPGTD